MSSEVKNRVTFIQQIQIFFWDFIIHILSRAKKIQGLFRFFYCYKKFLIPTFLLFLSGCMISGLINLPVTGSSLTAVASISKDISGCNSHQCNYVVIHVDQLKGDTDPQIVSMWLVLLNTLDEPQMIWKQLYSPEYTQQNCDHLHQGISSEGKATNELVKMIDSEGFSWNGYIVIDTIGVDQLMSWSTGRGSNLLSIESSGDDAAQLMTEEIRLTNNFCNHLNSGSPLSNQYFRWDELNPPHMSMNIDMSEFLAKWETFTAANGPVHCEVLPK